jgi:proteic killer suppression protein
MTNDIYHGINSKDARKFPSNLKSIAFRKLDMINSSNSINDLRVPPGNRLETLKGNLSGFHSIRINEQFRIIFKMNGANVEQVQIIDYHK